MKAVMKRVPACDHPGCRREAVYVNIYCQRGKSPKPAVYRRYCAEHQREAE